MKTLIAYYTRTGNTEIIADLLTTKITADKEKIVDLKKRNGLWGWLTGGREGMQKKTTVIGETKYNPVEYDLVLIGTPIWVNTPPAMRTYLTKFSGRFKKAAFFCTMGGSGFEKLFFEMTELSGAEPITTMAITDQQIKAGDYMKMVDDFVDKVKSV